MLLAALLVLSVFGCGFAGGPHRVVFYNLENLYDTIDDPTVIDEEYTPRGSRRWTAGRYDVKLANIGRVLSDIAAEGASYPVVVGLAEVEHRGVVEDLLATGALADAGYGIVHYDSPDARGVDVAFLYRPDRFRLAGSRAVPFAMPGMPAFRTRDILTMWGTIDGEPFYFLVTHWPSRLGGKEASAPKRMAAARQCYALVDSVLRADPATKVVLMGDLNDDPVDASLVDGLHARGSIRKVAPGELFNPFMAQMKAGFGTLAYRDAWNLFDNILVSENLATGSAGRLRIRRVAGSRFYGAIFTRPYMIGQEGRFRGYPLRTFSGKKYVGGFSDHLPVYIEIE